MPTQSAVSIPSGLGKQQWTRLRGLENGAVPLLKAGPGLSQLPRRGSGWPCSVPGTPDGGSN